ncbi:tyrosine-type recombinase/integrase [Paenibacillus sp. TAF43_2]|uniref:tyrosine-type recombinase/integrase n=1 Tax=Paenibacillus sp. TAF43_2 TaxID=3233069 RepID=UPI003F95E969
MSKLEKSKQKIAAIFRAARNQNITVKQGKARLSDKTYNDYEKIVMKYANKISKDFNISDVTKWKPVMFMKYVNEAVDDWKSGNLGVAFSIKQERAALEFFRHATIKTNTFKSEIECVDKDEIKKMLDFNHVRRSGRYTHTLSADLESSSRLLEEIKNSRSHHTEVAYHAYKIAMLTGARLKDVMNLTVGNINLNGTVNFTGTVKIEKSKGGLTRNVPIPEDTLEYLRELMEGKKSGDRIIRLYKEGDERKTMRNESAMRKLSGIVTAAGERAGLNKVETVSYKYRDENGKTKFRTTEIKVTASFHTARKTFVNERFVFYNSMDEERQKSMLEERLKDEKVMKKYQQSKQRINKTRSSGDRELYHYENAMFLASLDSGHFRVDVLEQFYLLRETLKEERIRVGKRV